MLNWSHLPHIQQRWCYSIASTAHSYHWWGRCGDPSLVRVIRITRILRQISQCCRERRFGIGWRRGPWYMRRGRKKRCWCRVSARRWRWWNRLWSDWGKIWNRNKSHWMSACLDFLLLRDRITVGYVWALSNGLTGHSDVHSVIWCDHLSISCRVEKCVSQGDTSHITPLGLIPTLSLAKLWKLHQSMPMP